MPSWDLYHKHFDVLISSILCYGCLNIWLQRKLKIANLSWNRRYLNDCVHLMNETPKKKMYFYSIYPSTLFLKFLCSAKPNHFSTSRLAFKIVQLKFSLLSTFELLDSLWAIIYVILCLSVRNKSLKNKNKLCAMSLDALGRNGALRKISVLQNFAILSSCNIKNMGEKGARSLLGSRFSVVKSSYFTYFTWSVIIFGHMKLKYCSGTSGFCSVDPSAVVSLLYLIFLKTHVWNTWKSSVPVPWV